MNRPEFPFKRAETGAAMDAELIELLRDCARQKMPALRRIHALTAPRLLAELLQLLGDRKQAEAALVDCYIEIWNEAGNFNPQRSQPRVWLMSLARHHAIRLLRDSPSVSPEEADSALGFQHVTLHYEGVPPEQRLLHLAWRTGRSPAEIARALQLPLRQVQLEIRSALAAMSAASP